MSDKYYPNKHLPLNQAGKNSAESNVKSKSALKREMTNLQKIGEDLVKLSPAKLDKIPMPEELIEAVMLARRLKNREGKRRQMQYIGKIMRTADSDKILASLSLFDHESAGFRSEQHRLEQWRDRLMIEGDKAISELILELPKIDRKHLRQLIRQASKEALENKPPAASRKIFKYLKES
ncbi:MAG: ribosome-associated protein [Saprospiraceae bacterium]|jgi:ribosome-associated protein